ncbi:FAD-dependent oxidoreductase [Roseisolibacter agri]|uniref:Pyridine nucleotide-disulfide oxidoreductase n=1 Tax=Roseisolibacter agri TaxID=2014610 RepID=A0AA37QB55_9BACT|nr:FAD-dependent oxidoreductase [Roseisolibacter agri]GLC25671.1 pyridine nucleotide-disulfide oxidoreductase [Roseisolibacter agri]
MSEPTTPPPGPDLARDGVALDQLREGEPFLGHAGDEAVLLVRQGDAVHAVGATCTHYGGPLAEGLVVLDDRDGEPTVRCPWHHACFSLRTGEALRAPALNPIPCWTVERRDGRAYVGARRQLEPLAADVAPDHARATFVLVGAGAAAHAAAEMLRRRGFGGRIVMVGREEDAPYDRPNLSKEYLAGDAPEEWIPLRPDDFYAQHAIELRRGAAVEAIDVAGRTVRLVGGEAIAWDRLLIATGASPIRLDIPGATLPHVHVLRSLRDSRALAAAAVDVGARTGEHGRVVVIGASFIGLEVAASLRARGLAVDVVAPEARPLERVLGPQLGDRVREIHEAKGVRFHLRRKPARIDADAVTLDDGTTLPAHLVVMGVGVRPELALAEAARLAMDRGVEVDAYLETSAPGVFAAGDIARWPDPHTGARIRVEHWVVAQRQGQVAARNMLGERVPYDDVPFFWSAHYGTSIRYVGHAELFAAEVDGDLAREDATVRLREVVTEGDAPRPVHAVVTLGRDRAALEAEVAMERAART